MSLIERMLDSIYQKQQETTSKLNLAFRTLLSCNGKDFMTKLANTFSHHFDESLSKHSNRIGQFLFLHNADNESLFIQQQQPSSINVPSSQQKLQAEGHLREKKNEEIITSNEQSNKRKKTIENDKVITQNPELKTVNIKKKHKQSQFLEQQNSSKQFTNQKIIEANKDKKNKNFNIKEKDRIQSLHQKQLDTIGISGKQDSRKNRLSRKSFQEENSNARGKSYKNKSRKMRTNLIKLTPIAQEKQKQMKRKEATQRIQAALQFVNNLPSKKKTILYPTQWRQQKSQKFLLNKNNSSPMNPNIIKLKELSQKYRLQKSRQLQTNMLQMSNFSCKQNKFSLQKRQAYNLYNINMLKNEVFQLKKM